MKGLCKVCKLHGTFACPYEHREPQPSEVLRCEYFHDGDYPEVKFGYRTQKIEVQEDE